MPRPKRQHDSVFSQKPQKKVRRSRKESKVKEALGSQGVFYKVKDIIDENATAYKIDWESNSETGETYSPSWQPKSYVNEEAVQAWKSRQPQLIEQNLAPARHQSLESHGAISNQPSPSIVPRRSRRKLFCSSSSSAPEIGEGTAEIQPGLRVVEIANSEPRSPTPEPLFNDVQIQLSQHSKYTESQYPTYISSSSSPKALSIALQEQPIRYSLGPSSSPHYRDPNTYIEGVVPDSQSPLIDQIERSPRPQSNSLSIEVPASNNLATANCKPNASTSLHLDSSASTDGPRSSYPSPVETDSESKDKRAASRASSTQRSKQAYPFQPKSTSKPSAEAESQPFQTQISVSPDKGSSLGCQNNQGFSGSRNSKILGTLPNAEDHLPVKSPGGFLVESSAASISSIGLTSQVTSPAESSKRSGNQTKTGSSANRKRELRIQSDQNSYTAGLKPLKLNSPASDNVIHTTELSAPLPPSPVSSKFPPQLRGALKISAAPGTPLLANAVMSSPFNEAQLEQQPSANSSLPVQDRIRSIRVLSAANSTARKTFLETSPALESRSTSAMPDTRPETQANDAPSPLPMGHFQSHAITRHSTMTPPKQAHDASLIKELPSPAPGRMEFIVPLPLPSRVQNQYGDTFLHSKLHIQRFLAGNTDQQTLEKVKNLIYRLHNVSTHIDLENETSQSQHEIPAEDEAKWASSSSSKFLFLEHLVKGLRHHDVRIAVVAKGFRLIHMLERFMMGLRINYIRTDDAEFGRQGISETNGRLIVHLVPTGSQLIPGAHQFVNLVVGFDPSFDANEPQIQALRASPMHPYYLTPVIHPIVYCSPAHLERCIECLPDFDSPWDRQRTLMMCIAQTQKDVGRLRDDEATPAAAAEEVVAFVGAGGAEVHWTLPQIRPVKVDGLELISSGQGSETLSQEHRDSDSHSAFRKRLPDNIDLEMGDTKRQRMTPGFDSSHISDSVFTTQTAQIATLRQELEKKEALLREKEAAFATTLSAMESIAADRDGSLADQMKALNELQNRYEKCNRMYHALKHEKKDREEELATAERRIEALRTSNEQLQEARKQLQNDLEETRDQLANSAVPEVADLERLRAEIRTLTLDKETLQRRADFVTQDFDFTRQQYQTASSAAAEAAAKVSTLEAENAALRAKASGEAAKLRQMNNRAEAEMALSQLSRAQLENDELREQLRRRERGRGMTTRTGSVAPRSPRLGTSPGRGSRAGSKAPGSRSGSPIRSFLLMKKGRGLIEQSL